MSHVVVGSCLLMAANTASDNQYHCATALSSSTRFHLQFPDWLYAFTMFSVQNHVKYRFISTETHSLRFHIYAHVTEGADTLQLCADTPACLGLGENTVKKPEETRYLPAALL